MATQNIQSIQPIKSGAEALNFLKAHTDPKRTAQYPTEDPKVVEIDHFSKDFHHIGRVYKEKGRNGKIVKVNLFEVDKEPKTFEFN